MTAKHTEMTQTELEQMQKFHKKVNGYSNADIEELQQLVRKYINPHQRICGGCTGDLAESKKFLDAFYLQYKDQIEERLNCPLCTPSNTANETLCSVHSSENVPTETESQNEPEQPVTANKKRRRK